MNTSIPSATPAVSATDAAASSPANSPPVATAASPAHNARSLLKTLQTDFPVFRDCLPLAIGIDKQLLARRPDIERKVLRIALGIHTNSLRYIKTMTKATTTSRFDLDGKPADEVADTHRQHASETLRERSKKDADRRKAEREAEVAATAERQRTEKLGQLVAKFGRGS